MSLENRCDVLTVVVVVGGVDAIACEKNKTASLTQIYVRIKETPLLCFLQWKQRNQAASLYAPPALSHDGRPTDGKEPQL